MEAAEKVPNRDQERVTEAPREEDNEINRTLEPSIGQEPCQSDPSETPK